MTQQELELPKGWVETKLDDVVTRIFNGTTEKQTKEKTKFPVTRIETISNAEIDLNRVRYLKKCSKKILDNYKIEYGDILFSNINSDSHLGKTAIFQLSDINLIHGMNLLLIRSNSHVIVPKFLNFIFNFHRFDGFFYTIAQHAVNQSSINQTRLKKTPILLPPLDEQKRIVSKIEELFSKIGSTKYSLEHTKLQLEQYRFSLLKYLFEGNHTEKWHETTLENITTSIGDGIHSTPKYTENSEFYFINGNNLRNGSITITAKTKMVEQSEFEKYKVNLNENTVLLSINGTIGNLAFYKNEKVILGKSACYINTGENLDPSFLFYLLQSNSIKSYFRNNLTSTTIYNLSLKTIRMTPIVLPTLTIQKQIVSQIEQGFSLIQNSQRIVNSTLQTLETMRMSVLKQAFEGKLVPQDPNDEPASVLLEQIKKQKS